MLFKLTNQQRRYLGLTPVEALWDEVVWGETKFNETIVLYFSGDKLVKRITVGEDIYHELDVSELTAENRTIVLPKTAKGKPGKLNYTALYRMNGIGVYFYFGHGAVQIANYSAQTTFYSSRWDQEKIEGLKGLEKWLDRWISDTSENDLIDINLFKSSIRQHCRYKEGDFFASKSGRRQYSFGRILLDVIRVRKSIGNGELKEKHYGLMRLMGKPLIVNMYKKTSHTMDVDLNELKQCEFLFSQAIMDNVFYYGEFKILGNQPLEPYELEFPVSCCVTNRDLVYLQYGLIYKETHFSEYSRFLEDPDKEGPLPVNTFRNEGIGFALLPSLPVSDLRHPNNAEIKREIFEHFGLDAGKSYYENYMEYQRTK